MSKDMVKYLLFAWILATFLVARPLASASSVCKVRAGIASQVCLADEADGDPNTPDEGSE
ncbi:MAG: hypothetical protein QHH07_11135 [Sedimentisphaerales bacterium]|nr:hypothetical protein [Sedimentisphaerales bacterium]